MIIYERLKEIADCSGTNAKKVALQNSGIPLRVFLYAYNPFWVYHIKDVQLQGEGDQLLGKTTWRLLDNLRLGNISGTHAKYTLISYARSLTPTDAIVLQRIIDRDLRLGLNIKSINSVFSGLIPTYDVMLAQKVDWAKVIYPCISSVKLDGIRAIYREGSFNTRSGKEIIGLDKLKEKLKGAPALDGELMIPGLTFQKSSGKLRSFDNTPTAQYHVFELPERQGGFIDRLKEIKSLVDDEFLIWVPHRKVKNHTEALKHYQQARSLGYEGTVLKPMDYSYERKRSKHWMKVKAIETYDVRVVGKYEGTGKYKGLLGGIEVKYGDKIVRVGGGFTDYDRKEIWDNFKNYAGCYCEIHAQEETDGKSLRHPRFIKWRLDK